VYVRIVFNKGIGSVKVIKMDGRFVGGGGGSDKAEKTNALYAPCLLNSVSPEILWMWKWAYQHHLSSNDSH
jgi:hypothetical protein